MTPELIAVLSELAGNSPVLAGLVILGWFIYRNGKQAEHQTPCAPLQVTDSKVESLEDNQGEQWEKINKSIVDVATIKTDVGHIREGQAEMRKEIRQALRSIPPG